MSHAEQAGQIVAALDTVIAGAATHLAGRTRRDGRVSVSLMDEHQAVLYDLASAAADVAAARSLVAHGQRGDREGRLALAWAADVHTQVAARLHGRWAELGVDSDGAAADDGVRAAVRAGRDPAFLAALGEEAIADGEAGPRHLPEDLEMVRQTFRRFAQERVMPVAERVHRNDEDVPEEIITGLAELGCFGLSVPDAYGGLAEGGDEDLTSMVVVTEELARGSLGVAGSLITRPEIVAAAILRGGTEEQKQRWLPAMAAGEKMCAVAVTEPDHGSDVAGIQTTATWDGSHWVLDGTKTWCTFAGRSEYLLVLARTDPDRSKGHRGLSLFLIEKPRFSGHEWTASQDEGGKLDARAIPTLGYRGMHSFEIAIADWRVPPEALIGMDAGKDHGFYLQMQAFANGRLQTAARALGVMQLALEEAAAYARERSVFGRRLADYQLTRVKVARMAASVAANRAFAFAVAGTLARGQGQLGASQAKQVACRSAEWVTREAQQLHGGYGYAEEYTVSRLFVDARVLSIFEGADETLALRVIARELLSAAGSAEGPVG